MGNSSGLGTFLGELGYHSFTRKGELTKCGSKLELTKGSQCGSAVMYVEETLTTMTLKKSEGKGI